MCGTSSERELSPLPAIGIALRHAALGAPIGPGSDIRGNAQPPKPWLPLTPTVTQVRRHLDDLAIHAALVRIRDIDRRVPAELIGDVRSEREPAKIEVSVAKMILDVDLVQTTRTGHVSVRYRGDQTCPVSLWALADWSAALRAPPEATLSNLDVARVRAFMRP